MKHLLKTLAATALAGAVGDGRQSLLPADRCESPFAFVANSLLRKEQAFVVFLPLRVLCHFDASETTRDRVFGCSFQFHHAVAIDGHSHGAGIWTIQGTDGRKDVEL